MTNEITVSVVNFLEVAILIYFFAVNTFYLVLLVSAVLEARRQRARTRLEERWRILGSDIAPILTVVAPAYNEAATIGESVRALLTLYYPRLELVVVNDGSTDETLEALRKEFQLSPVSPIIRQGIETQPIQGIYRSALHSNLVVVDKENGGKADALNAGLNVASGELFCAIDADTLIEPEALVMLARPFMTRDGVVAVGGTIRVANGSLIESGRVVKADVSRSFLSGIQTIEYLRAFLFGRLGWNRLGGNLIISGALGLFRREALLSAGGYLKSTVGEDIEIIARLRRDAIKNKTAALVTFVPDPVAWTEVPTSSDYLGRQRDRWHRGLAEVMWQYKTVLFNPRYRSLGMVSFPYFFLVELLAPVLEAIGLLGIGIAFVSGRLDVAFTASFFLIVYGYGVAINAAVVALDEFSYSRYKGFKNRLLLFGWSQLESFGYRQLTVYWRIRGLVRFFLKRKDWGSMTRTGFKNVDVSN